jgi:hypothetical protein
MSGIAGAGISNEAALLAQPSLTENVLAHLGQVRVCMITSDKEPLTCPILLRNRFMKCLLRVTPAKRAS